MKKYAQKCLTLKFGPDIFKVDKQLNIFLNK